MTSERLFNSFIHPQKLLYLPNKFLATPLPVSEQLDLLTEEKKSVGLLADNVVWELWSYLTITLNYKFYYDPDRSKAISEIRC